MRRLRLALALPLLLVFAQQGAMLHELSHIVRSGGSQQRYEEKLLQGKLCGTCVAFEQVGNPASAAISVLPAIPAVHNDVSAPQYSIIAAQVPIPHSRGPPRV
jgi:hypothetical protein